MTDKGKVLQNSHWCGVLGGWISQAGSREDVVIRLCRCWFTKECTKFWSNSSGHAAPREHGDYKTVQGWGTIRLEAVEERSPEVMRSVWEMVLRSSVGSWSRGRYQEVSESWLLAISNSFLQLICPILFPFYRHCPQTSSVQSHQCFVQLQHDIPYFILNSSAYQSMHQMPFSLPD